MKRNHMSNVEFGPFPQHLWFQITGTDQLVGGELLPIDSTALMLAGLQSSAVWMLPILAGAAGAGIAAFKLRRKF